tara:strand:+ start:1267 stop:1719 length:453 start_codon:yes stop_codon:yes gene_type:complete
MIKVDVFIKNKNWKKKISNPQKYLKSRVKYLRNSISFLKNKKINFSIQLAGNKEIKLLNKKFRKKSKSTDVLSFPYNNLNTLKKLKKKDIYLGDIILNYYKIKKKNFKENFNKLWIHGFLHLVGHKHKKNNDYYKMNKLEKLIFSRIQKK